MMRFSSLIYPITFLLQFHVISTQFSGNKFCICEDSRTSDNLTGHWGSWTQTPTCSGKCNQAFLVGVSECRVFFPNGTQLNVPFTCQRITATNNCSELCTGEWGPWDNARLCNTNCGVGEKEMIRVCYKKNQGGNHIRVSGCFGDDSIEQRKTETCRKYTNCNSTTVSQIAATVTTRSRVEETQSTTFPATTQSTTQSTTAGSTTAGSTSTQSTVDVEQTGDVVISPDIVLHRKTSGFNTVALASALGAAAIICVIIVFISAVVVFRAHDTLKTRIVTYATRQSSSSAITTISVKKNPQTEEQQMLPTAFYELDMQDDETIPSAYNESQKDENKPTEQLTEAVYFTVDDQKK